MQLQTIAAHISQFGHVQIRLCNPEQLLPQLQARDPLRLESCADPHMLAKALESEGYEGALFSVPATNVAEAKQVLIHESGCREQEVPISEPQPSHGYVCALYGVRRSMGL